MCHPNHESFWDVSNFSGHILAEVIVLDMHSLILNYVKFLHCRYTWKIYSERLMTLAGVYGFWKYVSKLERRETRRYLEMFYILKFRELVSFWKTILVILDISVTILT